MRLLHPLWASIVAIALPGFCILAIIFARNAVGGPLRHRNQAEQLHCDSIRDHDCCQDDGCEEPELARVSGELTGTLVRHGFGKEDAHTPAISTDKRPPHLGLFVVALSLNIEGKSTAPPFIAANSSEPKIRECRYRGGQFIPPLICLQESDRLRYVNEEARSITLIVPTSTSVTELMLPANGSIEMPALRSRPSPHTIKTFGAKSFVLVRSHPYMAVVEPSGKFTISELPIGAWTFMVFSTESGRWITRGIINHNPVSWPHGLVNIDIKSGDNNAGTIEVFLDDQ